MTQPQPFKISIPQTKLDAIRARVEAYRWFPAPANEQGFAYGMSTPVMKDLQRYWLDTYDWRAAERDLNRFPHFVASIDGFEVHFVHVVGEAKGQRPLLITHGWPGSFFEFWQAIGPLAFPSAHGGKQEDAFDLVIPSLPGYAFSAKPASPMGQRATAALWDKLMTDLLGYKQYRAQGGDWGSMVTSWLGVNHGPGKGGCTAIHLNMNALRPALSVPQTPEESEWIARSQRMIQAEGAYLMMQATKPQTLAMALMDSPMGTAAWIIEKFQGWSDLRTRGLFEVYTRDQLITNVMIYLVNDAIATSVWYYNALFQEGGVQLAEGQRCETPTGFASFPGETYILAAPKSWMSRAYNLTRWSELPNGGHFAAMEVPELYVTELREWARGA